MERAIKAARCRATKEATLKRTTNHIATVGILLIFVATNETWRGACS